MNDGGHDSGCGEKETNAWDVCEVDAIELSYSLDVGSGILPRHPLVYHPGDLGVNKRKLGTKQD